MQGDGATLRTHLQRLARNGKHDPRLNVQWPRIGREIWGVFTQLGRPPSMSGLARITQAEIQAWQQNQRVRLTPWELELITVFDGIAIDAANKQEARKR